MMSKRNKRESMTFAEVYVAMLAIAAECGHETTALEVVAWSPGSAGGATTAWQIWCGDRGCHYRGHDGAMVLRAYRNDARDGFGGATDEVLASVGDCDVSEVSP